MKQLLGPLLVGIAACAGSAWAQVAATVDVDTTHSTPLNANFSGFNDEVVFPAEYFDYRLNNLAAQLTPGWVRYPSGIFADAFDWQSGLMVASWVSQFQGTVFASLISSGVAWTNGKGGGSFVDAANRANFLGAKLIVDVNGYTDTPDSAGKMAAFAKANHIPVAVWELCNEPYLVKPFFSSATDYLNKVKPYRDAIKAADPTAIVAVFVQDAGDTTPNPPWDQALASYPDKYWDAITYHHYPAQNPAGFSAQMADENAVLASRSSAYVTGYLAPLLPAGTKFLISEFLPSNDGLGSGDSLTDGTLYGAVYAAEYVMRMSTVPSMLYVGMHAMTGSRGVYAVTTHYIDVQDAYRSGTTINTLNLGFGFFTVAQPLGLAVLNPALRNATKVDSTTLTGGATVPATGLGTIPALYAQAYETATGQQSVVITNKGATAHQVTIRVNGTPPSGTLPVTFIAGGDPTVQNTATNQNAVTVQTTTSGNPVLVPAYSVVRVDLPPPPVVTAVNSASYAVGTVAADSIVTLFGPGIASGTTSAVQISDSQGKMQPAKLLAVAPGQASLVLPSGLAPGAATVTVLNGSTAALTGSVTIASSAPGLYSMNSDGAGAAAAIAFRITPSNQIVGETAFTCDPGYPRSCLPAPLSLGPSTDTLYVSLYGTGIRGAASIEAYVAGQLVPQLYAGPAPGYPGEDQVNISIPRALAGSGTVRVYLIADGVFSNVVSLNIM